MIYLPRAMNHVAKAVSLSALDTAKSSHSKGIPFNKPFVTGNELVYLTRLVDEGEIGSDGRYTLACARLLKERFQLPDTLMVPSATAALEMAATLCGLNEGDEAIMPSFTFTSTANAVVLRGAKPVFVDIRPDTLNIDERLVEQHITSRTKAIFPVHYGGVSCEMDTLMYIARRHRLLLVEDAAQAVNARYKGAACGSIGDLGAYSFHGTKDYSCGEGGALCINSPGLIKRAEVLRDKGTDRARFLRAEVDKYTWSGVGSSYVPSELSSAYLLAQLEMMDVIKAMRQRVYERYREMLAPFEARELLALPQVPPECETNFHMFYVLLPSQDSRDKLLAHFRQDRIQACFHYVPLHLSPMGRCLGYSPGDFPRTEDLSGRLIRLPFFAELTEEDQLAVTESLARFFFKVRHIPSRRMPQRAAG